MLLYPINRCRSAVEDARAVTGGYAEVIAEADDRTFYRATLAADVGFSRPAEIVGLCVSDHDGGPLRGVPLPVLDAFGCELSFDRAEKKIFLRPDA